MNETWGHIPPASSPFADALLEHIRFCKLQYRELLWLKYCVNIFILFLNKRFPSFRFPTSIFLYTSQYNTFVYILYYCRFVVKCYHFYRYIVTYLIITGDCSETENNWFYDFCLIDYTKPRTRVYYINQMYKCGVRMYCIVFVTNYIILRSSFIVSVKLIITVVDN